MAWVGSTVGFQPLMVPSSVAKMNAAAPDLRPLLTTKPRGPQTIPVGAAGGAPFSGVGIVTIKGALGGSGKGVPTPL